MNNVKSDAWKAFQWVRDGESGSSREGYTPDIFDRMNSAEKKSAEDILLQDYNAGLPFSADGLTLLLDEKLLSEPKYAALLLNDTTKISIYGTLLLTTKNSKYIELLIKLYPSQDIRNKKTITGYFQSSLLFDNNENTRRLIINESDAATRRALATALYRSTIKSHMDFKKSVIEIYSDIESEKSKVGIERLLEKLILTAKP